MTLTAIVKMCIKQTTSLVSSASYMKNHTLLCIPDRQCQILTLTRSVGEAIAMPRAPVVRPAATLRAKGASLLSSTPKVLI